ncbi:hypothetical protein H1230_12525 [Paenibacillus sp. 19GGS1-52]|uniref:hypothetical protein n=1 Tax=Paenibacillus sp. 19GGS1-52 TaxID=2758563 RepID=UPI001EFB1E26|nr:hypothetical protein [Paenibacillus sp. 19GGS1-52]ULO09521.1 hypothetical protein H1230_12525 [Paenibacillus sp. 19GGS1-52]
MAGISGGVNAGVTWASNKLNGESTSVKDAAVSFGTGAVSGLLGGKGALADPEVKAATNSLSKLSGMANMGATWTKSGLDIAEETIRTTTRKAFTSGTGRGIAGSIITSYEDFKDITSTIKDKAENAYEKFNELFN